MTEIARILSHLPKRKVEELENKVLPRDTTEQLELFNQLDYAYIGGRYRSDDEFPVTKEQLDYWAAETQKRLDITETVCLDRIEDFKKIEKG